MANRFYTLMVIPERSARVRKWIFSQRTLKWGTGVVLFFLVCSITSVFMSLRYLADYGEYKEAQLKNRYLEGELRTLANKLATAESTMVRIQNFEQKLRTLARVDNPTAGAGGIGPITDEDERIMKDREEDGQKPTQVASLDMNDSRYRVRSLELSVADLQHKANLKEQSLQELYELLRDQEAVLTSTPSIWPAHGWVTSQFGYRISPFTGMRQLHEGLDVAAPMGTRVFAPADGVVTAINTEEGYGKLVTVNHGYGVVTRYGHNSEVLVKVGQKIRRGDALSMIGNTGRSTAPHLHYEVLVNGIPVNPRRYILN